MPPGFNWRRFLGWNRRAHPGHRGRLWLEESRQHLLPQYHGDEVVSAIPAVEVTKVCLRLRHLIEECIPCELEEDAIAKPHSKIITHKVVQAAREAGGEDNKGCVVYGLLVNKRWFKHQSLVELWDANLHEVRAVACEVIAKRIIESEEDHEYLLHHVLLRRYSIAINNEPTPPTNVIEKAVDLHALRVIGSSGYQKCISYLWKGWLVQDEDDPNQFAEYKDRDNTALLPHLDPDRMRSPMYQNAAQLLISLLYLALYTSAINTINLEATIDVVEWLLYAFTLGFVIDELVKVWKAGYHILSFWNFFNWTLYALLATSLVFRFMSLSHGVHDVDGLRKEYHLLSYNFLAFCAPMFWLRLMLYLDSFRFFGAMLVVIKVMMKESVIFFALLIVVIIGFLQAFVGLDKADDNTMDELWFIESMAKAVMQAPEFDGFDNFGYPFGLILYYVFTFVVMVILLNILIALYNSAYQDIYDNANDEFLALFSLKTMQFVRAPDENVYIPPFNLIEIFCVSLPFEWWMPKAQYERLNDVVMGVIYFPLLLVSAFFERKLALEILENRRRGEADDDTVEEWEQIADRCDFESDGWSKRVREVKSNVEEDPVMLEVRELRDEVRALKEEISDLSKAVVSSRLQSPAPAEPRSDSSAVQDDRPGLE